MNIIRARLDSEINDCPWLPAVLCWRVFLRVEFLNRIDGENAAGSSLHAFRVDHRRGVIGVVVVRAIHDEIVVLWPIAIRTNGEKPTTAAPLHARSQDHQILEIAAV